MKKLVCLLLMSVFTMFTIFAFTAPKESIDHAKIEKSNVVAIVDHAQINVSAPPLVEPSIFINVDVKGKVVTSVISKRSNSPPPLKCTILSNRVRDRS